MAAEFKPPGEIFVCMDHTGCYHFSSSREAHDAKMFQLDIRHDHQQRYEQAKTPDRIKHLINKQCWIHTTTGWTISIGTDSLPASCSVAAWPSEDDAIMGASTRWFQFDNGSISTRCFDIDDIREAINEITSAGPPP